MTKIDLDNIFTINPVAKQELQEIADFMGENLEVFTNTHFISVLKNEILVDNVKYPTLEDKLEVIHQAYLNKIITEKDYNEFEKYLLYKFK